MTANRRLVYDHQIFSSQEYGGISRYFSEVARRLDAGGEWAVTILAPAHINGFLRDDPPSALVGRYVPPLRRTARLRAQVNDLLSRLWSQGHHPAVVHQTYYRPTPVTQRGRKVVLTVYDMIHELYPEMFPREDRTADAKAAAVARADRVICISENTKRDLLARLGTDPRKVHVVPLAQALPLSNGLPPDFRRDGKRYVLYVGLRGGYKNFGRLLKAVAASSILRDEVRIIAFGGGPLSSTEQATVARLGLRGDAVHQCHGDDGYLASLYRFAAAFVYPSLYEGFGIPVLEAMAQSCPVICSNGSSFPEVAGDAAEYFDPLDVGSIRSAVEGVVGSASRAQELRARGQARARLFSWDRCAAETLAVYASLVDEYEAGLSQ